MRTIWKFPLKADDKQVIGAAGLTEFIHVGPDPQGQACLWGIVDTNEKFQECLIHLVGTGHAIPENVKSENYIGTLHVQSLIVHVFAQKI